MLTVVVEKLLNQIDVGQNHSSAAISLQTKLIERISAEKSIQLVI